MKNIDIKPDDLTIIETILKKNMPSEAIVWVFGSRSKNTAKPFSDLDLALDLGRALTLEEQAELMSDFENSLLPYKVDILDLHNLNDNFREIIEKDRKLLFQNNNLNI